MERFHSGSSGSYVTRAIRFWLDTLSFVHNLTALFQGHSDLSQYAVDCCYNDIARMAMTWMACPAQKRRTHLTMRAVT